MHLIGIAGPKRGGKGTVAQAVAALYNDGAATVRDVGFADKVKIAGMKALGFDRPDKELIALADQFKIDAKIHVEYVEPETAIAQDYGSHLHELSGREFLQWVGTEVGRDLFGETFWIDQVLPQPYVMQNQPRANEHADALMNESALKERYPDVDCLCITDVRFPNEAERILALGGVVWEVVGRTEFTEEHASEMPLPEDIVTRRIDNSGRLIDLEVEVEAALNDLPLV